MAKKVYDTEGLEFQTLRIKNMTVQCKSGEIAEELLDKMTNLIKRFSEDGNWWFKYDVES